MMHFTAPLAKTIGIMAGDAVHNVLDKDYIAWLREYSDRERMTLWAGRSTRRTSTAMHGTGPFMSHADMNRSVQCHVYDANPNYWRGWACRCWIKYHNVVIKDIGSRFTALWRLERSTTWERAAGA